MIVNILANIKVEKKNEAGRKPCDPEGGCIVSITDTEQVPKHAQLRMAELGGAR